MNRGSVNASALTCLLFSFFFPFQPQFPVSVEGEKKPLYHVCTMMHWFSLCDGSVDGYLGFASRCS